MRGHQMMRGMFGERGILREGEFLCIMMIVSDCHESRSDEWQLDTQLLHSALTLPQEVKK